jgi:hypothetical protein
MKLKIILTKFLEKKDNLIMLISSIILEIIISKNETTIEEIVNLYNTKYNDKISTSIAILELRNLQEHKIIRVEKGKITLNQMFKDDYFGK